MAVVLIDFEKVLYLGQPRPLSLELLQNVEVDSADLFAIFSDFSDPALCIDQHHTHFFLLLVFLLKRNEVFHRVVHHQRHVVQIHQVPRETDLCWDYVALTIGYVKEPVPVVDVSLALLQKLSDIVVVVFFDEGGHEDFDSLVLDLLEACVVELLTLFVAKDDGHGRGPRELDDEESLFAEVVEVLVLLL